MNDLTQKISNTLIKSVLFDRLALQNSKTVVVVRDNASQTLYSNIEFDKPFDADQINAVNKTGNPSLHIETIGMDNEKISCLTIYFPVKKNREITAIGMIGIPVGDSVRMEQLSTLSGTAVKTGPHDGMVNPSYILSSLQKEIVSPEHQLPTVVLISIDKFSKMNEEWGQFATRAILEEFCELIKSHLRSSDLFGKWAEKEFILILPDTSLITGKQIAKRIMQAIEHKQFSQIGHITASYGIATYQTDETIADFINRINAAVFTAKISGKNRVELKAGHLTKLVWRQEYECGHPVIDEQHRQLFFHSNELLHAIFKNRPKKQILPQIDKLLALIQKHFDEEERILASNGYTEAEMHSLVHRELVQKAGLLAIRFEKNELDFDEIFGFLANDIIIEHMQKEDRKFYSFLAEVHI